MRANRKKERARDIKHLLVAGKLLDDVRVVVGVRDGPKVGLAQLVVEGLAGAHRQPFKVVHENHAGDGVGVVRQRRAAAAGVRVPGPDGCVGAYSDEGTPRRPRDLKPRPVVHGVHRALVPAQGVKARGVPRVVEPHHTARAAAGSNDASARVHAAQASDHSAFVSPSWPFLPPASSPHHPRLVVQVDLQRGQTPC